MARVRRGQRYGGAGGGTGGTRGSAGCLVPVASERAIEAPQIRSRRRALSTFAGCGAPDTPSSEARHLPNPLLAPSAGPDRREVERRGEERRGVGRGGDPPELISSAGLLFVAQSLLRPHRIG
ncbi:hypothetical protein GUJ93_ZPchr0006g44440 [Zizania palustris]|uniref:Uncharacterized protein n=1 Tax=Zizania palustris TaxID=103762 RepID=A0A8J5T4R2_ZIZPA|nr:hypothetical protein GUJ93_ZPchr0006g44440 [Zizania palustris]